MAKFNEGIHGPFHGKVGKVVGATWKGIAYMRSAPKPRTTPPGKMEMANRKKWALSQSWLQPITQFVQIGWKGYSQKSEGFIAAKSYLLKNAFEVVADDVVINPALAKLSSGDLPLPAAINVSQPQKRVVQFTWDTNFDNEKAHGGDQILMLAYNVEEQEAEYNLVGHTRKTGSDILELRGNTPGRYHIYAAFIAYDRSRQSDSFYLGTMEFK
jgi:hypothetical protein